MIYRIKRIIFKGMKKFLVLSVFFIFLIFCSELSGQKIHDPIIKAFHKGDVEALSEYFNTRLQVNQNERNTRAVMAQAKEMMREILKSLNNLLLFQLFLKAERKIPVFPSAKTRYNNGNSRLIFFSEDLTAVYLSLY